MISMPHLPIWGAYRAPYRGPPNIGFPQKGAGKGGQASPGGLLTYLAFLPASAGGGGGSCVRPHSIYGIGRGRCDQKVGAIKKLSEKYIEDMYIVHVCM